MSGDTVVCVGILLIVYVFFGCCFAASEKEPYRGLAIMLFYPWFGFLYFVKAIVGAIVGLAEITWEIVTGQK